MTFLLSVVQMVIYVPSLTTLFDKEKPYFIKTVRQIYNYRVGFEKS